MVQTERIKDIVRKGEKELNLRIKMLRMTNKASWSVVNKYVTDPLCENEEDERKWTREVREAKEEVRQRESLDKSRFSVMLQIDRLVEQVSTGPRWLGTMFSMLWWHRKREERVALIEN